MSRSYGRLLAIVSATMLAALSIGAADAQTSAPGKVPQWTKAAPFPIPEEKRRSERRGQ